MGGEARHRLLLDVEEHAATRPGHKEGVKEHPALRTQEGGVQRPGLERIHVSRREALEKLFAVSPFDSEDCAVQERSVPATVSHRSQHLFLEVEL
jgi:hypothetical protein